MSLVKIDKPGVYDMPAVAYHADPCPVPSLSNSVGKVLVKKTARHAWLKHPRLNPHAESENKKVWDMGSLAHQLVLGDTKSFVLIDPNKHRNKDGGIPRGYTNDKMKAARDMAYNDGLVPVLQEELDNAEVMAKALRAQLSRHEDAKGAFTNGKCERTVIWTERHRGIDVWFRIRLDWEPEDLKFWDDYKSTTDASPEAWGEKQLFNMDFDFQAAFYRRGIRATYGVEQPRFRFIVQENDSPFAACVYEPCGQALEDAEAEVDRAIDRWAWSMANNVWPGYPGHTVMIDQAPGYHAARKEMRKSISEMYGSNSADMFQRMLNWQAPFDHDAKKGELV